MKKLLRDHGMLKMADAEADRLPVQSKYFKMAAASTTYDCEHPSEMSDGCANASTIMNNDTSGNKWRPNNWEIILDNIREMRKFKNAPVDTMGCNSCADPIACPEVQRYQNLVALMLSSQTKDIVTYAAMLRLRMHGLTVDNIMATSEDALGEIINPVGFWKTKAKHIKRTTEILKDEYNGDIPKTVDELCQLPGVGPKMAHLCMKSAWGIITGIGVDTHVHRISNRLKLVENPTKQAEKTRVCLESWLPKELWAEVNHLLVGFGQQICKPVSPDCRNCLNNKLCPASSEMF